MLKTTTSTVDGRQIVEYLDIVVGEAILGAEASGESTLGAQAGGSAAPGPSAADRAPMEATGADPADRSAGPGS